jgi:hypothetical protein
MPRDLPNPTDIRRAIAIYLARAYGSGALPGAVKDRAQKMNDAGDQCLDCSAVERDCPDLPTRYCLRLGNRVYPHMKLVIDPRPDGLGFLFRVDSHDRHICPAPGSREYLAFTELMRQNQAIASEIEADWEAAGLPTFKKFLREDLARRK